MGLFDLFSRKPKISGDELIRQRDAGHLVELVEREIFHPQYIYLEAKREQQNHHFNFTLDWRIHNTDLPSALFTMSMRRDIYVASGQTVGPAASFTPYGLSLKGTYEVQQQDKIASSLRIAQNYIIDSANAGNEEARFFAQRLAR